jgi:hypothetical protein
MLLWDVTVPKHLAIQEPGRNFRPLHRGSLFFASKCASSCTSEQAGTNVQAFTGPGVSTSVRACTSSYQNSS